MYDFKKKLKNYYPIDKFYWLTKIVNLLAIVVILLIFIFANIYRVNNSKNRSNLELYEGVKKGLWVFSSNENRWVLTKFSFFLIILSAIVSFFQIILTIISIKHSNYIKIFLLTNLLLIFVSIVVMFNILFINPNWVIDISQIWWVVDGDKVQFSRNAMMFIITITILLFLALILYFFDMFLNLKLRREVDIYIMNKNYRNQNYKQKIN